MAKSIVKPFSDENLLILKEPHASGFSLVEIMVGVTILSLMLLPVMGLLSQSRAHTTFSYTELEGIHFVRELLDQTVELARNNGSSNLKMLCRQSGKTVNDLFEEMNAKLSDLKQVGVKMIPFGNSTSGLIVSPLSVSFQKRYFRVNCIDSHNFRSTLPGKIYQIDAGVAWAVDESNSAKAVHNYEASVFILVE
ncbi:MAG: prepilin-type N-terminal cleavage/methylation domain-containing protein [Candidatus Riflebacteria bacterium]|nr:prepilin-type N-terminal cleavage/methylation domain-containing protein [Candidatus Riflebacteria bacterium]